MRFPNKKKIRLYCSIGVQNLGRGLFPPISKRLGAVPRTFFTDIKPLGAGDRLDGNHQKLDAGHHNRVWRIAAEIVLTVLHQLAHHLRGVLLRDRVFKVESDDRVREVPVFEKGIQWDWLSLGRVTTTVVSLPMLQLIVVGHVGGNLLDQGQQNSLFEGAWVEHRFVVRFFEGKFHQAQIVG